MSAAVQAWDIEPNIKIDVILLARPVGIFGVESGAGDNQKFILKTSDAMSVTRIFKLVFRKNVEGASAVVDYFKSSDQLL